MHQPLVRRIDTEREPALLVRGAEWLPTLRTRFPEYDGDVV
jgi:hypothetical protein